MSTISRHLKKVFEKNTNSGAPGRRCGSSPWPWLMSKTAPGYLWYSYLIAYIIEILVIAALHFGRLKN